VQNKGKAKSTDKSERRKTRSSIQKDESDDSPQKKIEVKALSL
jgi:hypothetical protein